jgi:hypothetical protein
LAAKYINLKEIFIPVPRLHALLGIETNAAVEVVPAESESKTEADPANPVAVDGSKAETVPVAAVAVAISEESVSESDDDETRDSPSKKVKTVSNSDIASALNVAQRQLNSRMFETPKQTFDRLFRPSVLSDKEGFISREEAPDYAKRVVAVIDYAKLHDREGHVKSLTQFDLPDDLLLNIIESYVNVSINCFSTPLLVITSIYSM